MTSMPLTSVRKTIGSSTFTLKAGEDDDEMQAEFDAVIINSDADKVVEKVDAAGRMASWSISQVQYETARFRLHSNPGAEVEALRALAATEAERPALFYTAAAGSGYGGKLWEGSRLSGGASAVTVDVCALEARSFCIDCTMIPVAAAASGCNGDAEILATVDMYEVDTYAVTDQHKSSRRLRVIDSWSVFFSVAVFPHFQGEGGLWYTGAWCVDAHQTHPFQPCGLPADRSPRIHACRGTLAAPLLHSLCLTTARVCMCLLGCSH